MLRIKENEDRAKYILLIPSMLDQHYPVLKYCFYSKNYFPVILENEDGVTDVGLKYVNNDMCYPSILNTGQMIDALQSGKYDLSRTLLLMPTAGDACRGSNYVGIVRRAVKNAGLNNKVICLNLKGLEKDSQFKIEPLMAWRALFGLYYGDILMLLVNQLRPYEKEQGAVNALFDEWVSKLAEDIKNTRHLTIHHMKKNFYKIAEDFSKIELTGEKKKRVGIVGEVYIKYCHLGNWNLIKFLEEHGCESHTNGLSWYSMYYMDTHLADASSLEATMYRIGLKLFAGIQDEMIKALRKYNFYTLERYETLKKEAAPYVSYTTCIGDGWLIGAEMVGHILHDCERVVATQPFGCLPNHTCGRGTYPSIQRKLPQGRIVSVDVDSSGSQLNYYNRIEMLISR